MENIEKMTFAELAEWALEKGGIDAITERTIRICLQTKFYEDSPEEWRKALLASINDGKSLDIAIERTEDGEDDKYLPYLLT